MEGKVNGEEAVERRESVSAGTHSLRFPPPGRDLSFVRMSLHSLSLPLSCSVPLLYMSFFPCFAQLPLPPFMHCFPYRFVENITKKWKRTHPHRTVLHVFCVYV